MDHFEQAWVGQEEWLAAFRKDVKSLYQKYADSYGAKARIETFEQLERYNKVGESSSDDDMRTQGRITDGYRAKKRRKLETEWELFVDRSVRKEDENLEDTLQWWQKRDTEYPVLNMIAFDLFSIPAMSAEGERVFSQAKMLITDERNRLGHDTVQAD